MLATTTQAASAAGTATSAGIRSLTLTAAVGSGLVAGVFFAFSTFVMAGLRKAPDRAALQSMQGINLAAPTPVFMVALLGTGAVAAVVGTEGVLHLDRPGAGLRVAGAALYLSAIALTAAYHVPHNDALAAVDPAGAGAGAAWRSYAGPWTMLNHVRTLTSAGALVAFILALGAD